MKQIKSKIRSIPDFPKTGILFRDITPVLQDKNTFREIVDKMTDRYKEKQIKHIAAIESRGFIFGSALAYSLGCGFVPVRKKGKLPADTYCVSYELEYGSASLEIHKDAVKKQEKVVIIDDLLATGGTALAAAQLVEKCGGLIHEISFLIELKDLKARQKFKSYNIFSWIEF
jgi:adenine phosphoribosyltransferase